MRRLVTILTIAVSGFARAQTPDHEELVEKYREADTWSNRANFYVGARGGVAIPSGALGVAPSAGIEIGVAPEYGVGIGLHALWMNRPPGAPVFGIQPAAFAFGAMVDLRYYIPTIKPLSLYPTLGLGFLAGPDLQSGTNTVMPLFNPGFGARLNFGNFYGAFEFGLSGFTIPYVALSIGYQGDRKHERAEAWARKQEWRLSQGLPVQGEAEPKKELWTEERTDEGL